MMTPHAVLARLAASSGKEPSDPASLDRLHDLVLLTPVPRWPPAPGWYWVGALMLCLMGAGAVSAVRRWRANAYRRAALDELRTLSAHDDNGNSPVETLSQVSALLKRVALAAYPRTEVASLTGASWIDWLNRTGKGGLFQGDTARLLVDTAYRPAALEAVPPEQIRALLGATRQWIQRH